MSMSAAPAGGRGKVRRPEPVAEINVTPLVDVMLVLLVMFIITAPAMKEGIHVDLPKAKGGKTGGVSVTGMSVILDSNNRVHFGDKTMEPAQVAEQLPKLLKGFESQTVTLKAHRQLPYDSVVRVISIMRAAGVTGISIAVDGAK